MQSNLKRWIGRMPDVNAVFGRFTVAVVTMAIFTLVMIVMLIAEEKDERLTRMLGGLILGAYLSVSFTLSSEGQDKSPNWPLQVIVVLAAAAIGWFSESLRFNLAMAIGAAVLVLGNAVRWARARDDLHVWDFTHKIWTGAIFSVVGSIIFLWGMLAIMASLKMLFEIDIEDLVTKLLLPVGFGFLAPLYWLSTVPAVDESYAELYENPGFVSKACAFMGTWLLAPLTMIYALILLAYGVKIILQGSLPNGEVATLVSPFLIIGTLTWLVLAPPFALEKPLAKLFRKSWFPLVIPAALLLAVAVGVRLQAYGITPERLALLMLVLWALGLALWFTFGPKDRRDIRLIPGSAAVLLAVGSLCAGWFSISSQSARFEMGLRDAGITATGNKVATPISIKDEKAARRAKGALQYLMSHNGKTRVAHIMTDTGLKYELNFDSLQKALTLDTIQIPNRFQTPGATDFHHDQTQPLLIAGYDRLYGPFTSYSNHMVEQFIESDTLSAKLKNNTITFESDGATIGYFDSRDWYSKQDFEVGKVTMDAPKIIVMEEDDKAIALMLTNFNKWENASDKDQGFDLNATFIILTRGFD